MTKYEWTAIIFSIISLGLYLWWKWEQHRRKQVERYFSAKNAIFHTMKHFRGK